MAEGFDFAQLADRLRAISVDDGTIQAGQVRLLGLAEIREAAGDGWPRMRARVRAVSLQILSRLITHEDVVLPAGDGFLIVLANGTEATKQAQYAQMREALIAFYLGDEALKSLKAEIIARRVALDSVAEIMSPGRSLEASARSSRRTRDDIDELMVFLPQEQRIAGRWICPVRRGRTLQSHSYDCEFIRDGAHHRRDFLLLDQAILAHARQRASDEGESGLAIGFTVHASTLQKRKSREAWLSMLVNAPLAFRNRALVVIAEIQRGTPLVSLGEWCSTISVLAPRVCLDFHHADHALDGVGTIGAWAAGFHLPAHPRAQTSERAQRCLDQIKFWSKAVHAQGVRLAVSGFREIDLVERARGLGLDIATSGTLWAQTQIGARVARGISADAVE